MTEGEKKTLRQSLSAIISPDAKKTIKRKNSPKMLDIGRRKGENKP